MALKNLECQLALAQLKRYAAGAKLSVEALDALESHICECEDCRAAARVLRTQFAEPEASLAGPQVGSAPTVSSQAVVQERRSVASAPANPYLSMPTASPSADEDAPKVRPNQAKKLNIGKGNAKTLALSGALGLVLMAMSTLASDPTKLFGDRALRPGQNPASVAVNSTGNRTPEPRVASASTERAPAPEAASTTNARAEGTVAASAVPDQPSEPAQAEVAETPTRSEPAVVENRPAPRVQTRRTETRRVKTRRSTANRTRARAQAPRRAAVDIRSRTNSSSRPSPSRRSGSQIRVYDENGNEI